jgi:hypothetical protein
LLIRFSYDISFIRGREAMITSRRCEKLEAKDEMRSIVDSTKKKNNKCSP